MRESVFVQMENRSTIYLDLGEIEVDYNALLTFTSQKEPHYPPLLTLSISRAGEKKDVRFFID